GCGRHERSGQCLRRTKRALAKCHGAVRTSAVSRSRRRVLDAKSSVEVLANRNQWPARGLGGAGAARENETRSVKRNRCLYFQVHLVRDRQRAGKMGSADAGDGGSQSAVYFCPSPG